MLFAAVVKLVLGLAVDPTSHSQPQANSHSSIDTDSPLEGRIYEKYRVRTTVARLLPAALVTRTFLSSSSEETNRSKSTQYLVPKFNQLGNSDKARGTVACCIQRAGYIGIARVGAVLEKNLITKSGTHYIVRHYADHLCGQSRALQGVG